MSNDAPPTDGRTRREVLGALGAGAAGSVLASRGGDASAAAAGAVDWPQANADAANSGHLPDGRGPSGTVQQGWTTDNDRYHEGLAVADGTVYVGGKTLAAVDAADGTERWQFDPAEGDAEAPDEGDTAEFGTPAVADGQVYAAVGFGVYDGTVPGDDLVAVDAATGAERWRFDPADSSSFTDPTVADGTVYVRRRSRADGREAGTRMHALAPDGSVRWTRSLAWRTARTPVCVDSGLAFAPGADGVTALDAETGAVAWEALPRVAFDSGPQPVVAHGTLYVAETNGPGATLVALDAATGAERWRRAFGTQDRPSFVVGATDDRGLYVQWDGAEADVIALAPDGSERWRTAVTAADERARVWTSGLARVGDHLYAGESALDPEDGSVVWKRSATEPSPVGRRLAAVADGRSYLVGAAVTTLSGADAPETRTGTASAAPSPTEETRTTGPRGTERGRATTSGRRDTGTGRPADRSGTGTPATTTTRPGTAATPENVSTRTGTTATGASGPGFGALAGLSGVGAIVLALARRRDDGE